MGRIYWDTDCNAPGCIGRIVDEETGRDALIQADYDWPSVADTFGWDKQEVQPETDDDFLSDACEHGGTDGTVACPDCGCSAGQFIDAAGDFLRDNDGATADDPGYFGND